MGKPVSSNKLAGILDVSRTAVRNAIKDGRIKRLANGLIDPDEARASWEANTDPSRSRVRTSLRTSPKVRTQGAHPAAEVRTEADARRAISLVARILAEEGAADDGKGIDFGKARTAELILKARQRQLDQSEQERRLVDRAAAEKLFFDTAREMRDAWMGWPSRIAITLADDLGVDARRLTVALDREVRKHLAEMGEPTADPLAA